MQLAPPLYAGTHVLYGITQCYLHATRQKWHSRLYPGHVKADPGGMQGWVDLVWLVTYQGGIPAQRRSPMPVLTGLDVE